MLRPTDPWFLDEAVEDPTDLVKMLPEIRQGGEEGNVGEASGTHGDLARTSEL